MPTIPENISATRNIRLGVLISGGGRTLVNFAERIHSGELNAEIPIVISSRASSRGIERAADLGLECHVVDRGDFSSVDEYSESLFNLLREARVDLVTLAGFLKLIRISEDFDGRVMNIHPSLIPAFCGPGLHGHHVHTAAIERGVHVSGCTVHFADNEYDHGPIILQRTVNVPDNTSADELAALVFAEECVAYPEAVRLFASGRLQIIDGRVHLTSD